MARTLTNVRSAVSIPDAIPAVVRQEEVTAVPEAEVFAGAQKKEAGALIQKETEVLGGRIDAFETGKAKIELGEMANEIAARVEQTPDHGKWDELYKTEMRKAADAVSKKISSGDARAQFGIEAGGLMTRGSARMRGLAKTRENQVRNAEVLTYAEKSLQNALKADNTEDVGYYLRSTHAMIDDAVKRFGLSPLTAFNMKQAFVKDFASGMVATRTPAQALKDLKQNRNVVNGVAVYDPAPTGTYVDFIPKDLREKMIRQLEAKTSGQTVTIRSQGMADGFMALAEKHGWSEDQTIRSAMKNSAYKERALHLGEEWTDGEIAEVRDNTVRRLKDRFVPLNQARAITLAGKYMEVRGGRGERLARTKILDTAKAKLKSAKDLKILPAVLQIINAEYNQIDKDETVSKIDSILSNIKPGTSLDKTLKLTDNMRPGIKDAVREGIRAEYKHQAEALKAQQDAKYNAVLAQIDKASEGKELIPMPGEVPTKNGYDVIGMTQQQRKHIFDIVEDKNLSRVNPKYRRTGEPDGDLKFWAAKHNKSLYKMTPEQLEQNFKYKVSQEFWDKIIKPTWGGGKEAAGVKGATILQRIQAGYLQAGGDLKEKEDLIRFRDEVHERIKLYDAKTVDAEDKIIKALQLELFRTNNEDNAGAWTMDPKERLKFANQMSDADKMIPGADQQLFADSLMALIRQMRLEGVTLSRQNMAKAWPTFRDRKQ